jgi:hypothetical protein
MKTDPIVEEVRQHRQEYAQRFNYDAQKILKDLTRRASEHKDRLVSYQPKPARTKRTA